MGYFKDLIQGMGNSVGGGMAGSIGGQIGYGLGELTGYNDALQKRQLEQQRALTDMQREANLSLMKDSYKQQLQLWKDTNYGAQMGQIKAAGLNPALIYGTSGTGGSTGGGGASVGGGSASDASSMQIANTNQMMQGLAMMRMKSEIAVNESVANKNNAEAKTTEGIRDVSIEEMKQRGKQTWLRNLQDLYKMNPEEATTVYKNKIYGEGGVMQGGLFDQQLMADILKATAEAGNAEAQALLSNTKAQGYWTELANATKNADSQAIQAAAIKLAAEFNYGEYTNWKYWVKTSQDAFGALTKGVGEFYNPVKTVQTVK